MAEYEYQFVNSISATPTVRLDLRRPTWRVRPGTTFHPPELRRASVSTLMRDGETYPADAYANRVINLVVQVDAGSDDATAAALQQLYRELDRPRNLLRYKPGTGQPVFFRTYRAVPGSVEWDPFVKEVRAAIPADPCAVGLRQTLATTVVPNDPASAGGCYLDVTGVQGDVETPLYMVVDGGIITSNGRRATHVAVRRRGTPSAAPMLIQAEAMTMVDADTTVQANSALMSGAGSNFIRTTFAAVTAMAQRAYAPAVPASPSVDARGRYRIYGRFRQTVANAGVFAARVAYGYGGQLVGATQDPVVLPTLQAAATPLRWVDLGDIVIPVGWDPVCDGPAGVPLPARGVEIWYSAQRVTAGGGSLDLDALLLVPADDATMIVRWPGQATGGPVDFVVDSDQVAVYGRGASAEICNSAAMPVEGGGIMVSPGVTNRLTVLRDVAPDVLTGDDITASTTITPHCWPQYLHVRPVAL